MRLIPSVFRQLHQLPWRGAITPVVYQRFSLRMYLAMLWLMLVYAAGVGIYVGTLMLVPNAWLDRIVMIALIGIGGTAVIWMLYAMLKMELLRARNLGFGTRLAVGFLVLMTLLDGVLSGLGYLSENPLLVLMGGLPFWFFSAMPYLRLLGIVSALFTYWMYFEDKPLCTRNVTPLLDLLPTPPKRFESAMLVLQQIAIFYGIFSAPLHIIFNY